MSVLARHKKLGGFKKLVNSLEITPPEKREKILASMRDEDPAFVAEVEHYIFNFKEFKDLPDMALTDVIFNMKNEMKFLAMALYKTSDEALLNKFKKCMQPSQATAFRDESQLWDRVTVGEQMNAQFRIIKKARELQDSGLIMLKKYSPKYSGG